MEVLRRLAPATGPSAGRQRRGVGGGAPTERIPRGTPLHLARRGEIATKTQKLGMDMRANKIIRVVLLGVLLENVWPYWEAPGAVPEDAPALGLGPQRTDRQMGARGRLKIAPRQQHTQCTHTDRL
jgi:hypothetical protein